MRVLGINGILSRGGHNTDLMLRDLSSHGHETCEADHPLRHLWQTRSRSQQYSDAKRLIDQCYTPGQAVIAHSYGGLVNLRMMELGARFSEVFWFRPAMNRDYLIPMHAVDHLHVIHSPRDRAILLGSVLPWHDFGAAGRHGLLSGEWWTKRADQRVTNYLAPNYAETDFWRHSEDFLDANRPWWVEFINGRL